MLIPGHEEKRGNARYRGFAIDLIAEIATSLSFDYIIGRCECAALWTSQ